MQKKQQQSDERYTYGDYLKWPDEERWELIDGQPYDMTPAPTIDHQSILLELSIQFGLFFRGKKCRVFIAPVDVLFPKDEHEKDEKVQDVVQPDLIIVCDPEKIGEKRIRGSPDLAIEIVSPSTVSKDTIKKRRLYEKHGVKEFWLVHPIDRLVTTYSLGEDGFFQKIEYYDSEATIKETLFPGLEIDLKTVFPKVVPREVKESPAKYKNLRERRK
ncbi:MAG: Uma2 family endonuclease [Candidatus Riflebacteria bacterium]|nr:Uma2 family endonuclease [Candidatus Riflebacteria bacterium]